MTHYTNTDNPVDFPKSNRDTRIKELMSQAGISILYEYDGYDGHAAVANLSDIEKFAELIVQECMRIAMDWDDVQLAVEMADLFEIKEPQ